MKATWRAPRRRCARRRAATVAESAARAQLPQRLEVAVRVELDERAGRLGGGGALRVDDDDGGRIEAQPLQQARVGDGRVGAPDDHELGPVADLAERRRARADRLVGRTGAGARGIDHGADRLGERHRPALRLAARLAQAVDERRARLRAGSRPRRPRPRRGSPRARRRGRPAAGRRCARRTTRRRARTSATRPALGVTSMSSQTQPHPAQVASATRRHLHAQLRAQPRGLLARAPASASSGVAAVATTVQIGRPAAIRSPGCGTSRTPRSSQRSVSPTVTSSVANRTALPAAPERSGLDARQLAGAGAQVRVEHAGPVRRLDRLERRGRARVDLERPRALAVPDEVDAEQPAQRERGRHARADRARLVEQLAGRHARRDDVPAPAVAADAERALARRAAR